MGIHAADLLTGSDAAKKATLKQLAEVERDKNTLFHEMTLAQNDADAKAHAAEVEQAARLMLEAKQAEIERVIIYALAMLGGFAVLIGGLVMWKSSFNIGLGLICGGTVLVIMLLVLRRILPYIAYGVAGIVGLAVLFLAGMAAMKMYLWWKTNISGKKEDDEADRLERRGSHAEAKTHRERAKVYKAIGAKSPAPGVLPT